LTTKALDFKSLKSLLSRQKAFRKEGMPFIEPLVFVSHPGVINHLSGNAEHYVCLRNTPTRPASWLRSVVGNVRA